MRTKQISYFVTEHVTDMMSAPSVVYSDLQIFEKQQMHNLSIYVARFLDLVVERR